MYRSGCRDVTGCIGGIETLAQDKDKGRKRDIACVNGEVRTICIVNLYSYQFNVSNNTNNPLRQSLRQNPPKIK